MPFRIDTAVKRLIEDKQTFTAKFKDEPGFDEAFDKYWNVVRKRVSPPKNDIDWWIKRPFGEFKKFVAEFDARKKSVRRSDQYAKKAKDAGARFLGEMNGYEMWWIPTYEAAVQIGRFYKNLPTHWCICTDDSSYFNRLYANSEFVFLVYSDIQNCPYDGCEKLALQFERDGEEPVDYRLWDVGDNDIQYDSEYRDGMPDVEEVVFRVLDDFKTLVGTTRRDFQRARVEKIALDPDWLANNLFKKYSFSLKPDSVEVDVPVADLEDVIDEGGISYEFLLDILEGQAFYDFERETSFSDVPAKSKKIFDGAMKGFGLTWKDVERIGENGSDGSSAEDAIEEMLEENFDGNSISYDMVYADCANCGACADARDDIMNQLAGEFYVRGYDGRFFKCEFPNNIVKKMAGMYLDEPGETPFRLLRMDADHDVDRYSFEEPNYGYSGFDEGMFSEAVAAFAKRLIGRLTMSYDSPGQTYFDFDREYLDNPDNLPRS